MTTGSSWDSFGDWQRNRLDTVQKPVHFVPTMGALHAGHGALIERARQDAGGAGEVVVSVFVNPTQFNDPRDLEAYPVTRESDEALAFLAGADAVVFPTVSEMYPAGIPRRVGPADYGPLTVLWEAAHRPGHFDGVVAVVRTLFSLACPTLAYFGEKDWQQLAVVRELARREFPQLTIVPVATVRESDGLALSSRNVRLSDGDRKKATRLHGALMALASSADSTSSVERLTAALREDGFDVEYLAVVDGTTLSSQAHPEPGDRAIVAASIGGVRLIDNVPISQ